MLPVGNCLRNRTVFLAQVEGPGLTDAKSVFSRWSHSVAVAIPSYFGYSSEAGTH